MIQFTNKLEVINIDLFENTKVSLTQEGCIIIIVFYVSMKFSLYVSCVFMFFPGLEYSGETKVHHKVEIIID